MSDINIIILIGLIVSLIINFVLFFSYRSREHDIEILVDNKIKQKIDEYNLSKSDELMGLYLKAVLALEDAEEEKRIKK